jgi:hypothetical protein
MIQIEEKDLYYLVKTLKDINKLERVPAAKHKRKAKIEAWNELLERPFKDIVAKYANRLDIYKKGYSANIPIGRRP